MPTYYDALNDFHRRNATQPLHSAAQLLYLHLLHMNNCLGNRGQVKATDRQLEELLRVTRPTITQAKRQLKNAGLIDFDSPKSPRTGTLYQLPFFTATNFIQSPRSMRLILAKHLAKIELRKKLCQDTAKSSRTATTSSSAGATAQANRQSQACCRSSCSEEFRRKALTNAA